MTWGKSSWGKATWGLTAAPTVGSKFYGLASHTADTVSKFSGHAGAAKTESTKFKGYSGLSKSLYSYFSGISLKVVISRFSGYALAERILAASKFAGSAGAAVSLNSKFAGHSGAVNSKFSKFAGYCKKDSSLITWFRGYAGVSQALETFFKGDAATEFSTESSFYGTASTSMSKVASYFSGSGAYVPLIYSKFYGRCYNPNIYTLGGYDLTHKIRKLDWEGFLTKVSAVPCPDCEDVEVENAGYEPGIATIELKFSTDEEMQDFYKAVDSLSKDVVFVPGRDDRYMIANRVSVTPIEALYLRKRFRLKLLLYFGRKYVLSNVPVTYFGGWSEVLPVITPYVQNCGSYKSQFTFRIGGFYNGGHAEYLVATLYDNGVAERTFPISDKLLSEELLVLDEDGVITGTYEDSFASSTQYMIDASFYANCSWSAGKVRLAALGNLTYRFAGPLILENAIKLHADLTIVGGAPLIQISVDGGVTYSTSIPAADMASGLKTYDLSGSEKYDNVYVRFYCPAGATLDIKSVAFETKRDLASSVYQDQLPQISPGESRALGISCTGGGGVAKVNITHRSRWRP